MSFAAVLLVLRFLRLFSRHARHTCEATTISEIDAGPQVVRDELNRVGQYLPNALVEVDQRSLLHFSHRFHLSVLTRDHLYDRVGSLRASRCSHCDKEHVALYCHVENI